MVVAVVLLGLMAVAPSPTVLVGLLFVGGLGSAAFHPAATAMVRAASGGKAETAVGLVAGGGTVGVALGPVVLISLLSLAGTAVTPVVAVPGLVAAGWLWYAARRHPAAAASGARGNALRGLPTLLRGTVGVLALVAVLADLAWFTFLSAMPLWLVGEGLAHDATVIGWTLATFNLAAAAGGVAAGWLSSRVGRRSVVVGSLAAAAPAMAAVLLTAPGSIMFFVLVALGGAFSHGAHPVLIVAAQEAAPDASATATGLVMGFAMGAAGVLYIGVGALQQLLTLEPAMLAGFIAALPAAGVGWWALTRRPDLGHPSRARHEALATVLCRCATCHCAPCPGVC